MYNPFNHESRKKNYPSIFDDFSLLIEYEEHASYSVVERLYYNLRNAILVVKDEKVSERLVNIIRTLKKFGKVKLKYMSFRIFKVTLNKEGTCIKAVDFSYKLYDKNKTNFYDRLKIFVDFVFFMANKGYYLDINKFKETNPARRNSLCDFLTAFTEEGSIDDSIGYIIKFIHYAFFYYDQRYTTYLEDFYKDFEEDGIIYNSRFSYGFDIIRLCYNYYVSKQISYSMQDIIDILDKEDAFMRVKNYRIMFSLEALDNKYQKKETEEYILYDSNIKIYKNMTSEFKEYLLQISDKNYVYTESIDDQIFDINGNFVGIYIRDHFYNYLKSSLRVCKFENQEDLINIFTSISHNQSLIKIGGNHQNIDLLDMGSVILDKDVFKFSIEEGFIIRSILIEDYKTAMINAFLIKMKEFIEDRYKNLSNNDIYKIPEVRYLSPSIAKMIVSYMLGEEFKYAIKDFEIFVREKRSVLYNETVGYLVYDPRYCFEVKEGKFYFKDEIIQILGRKIVKGETAEFGSNQKVVMFPKSKNIEILYNYEEKTREKILENVNLEKDNFKIICYDSIILTDSIKKSDFYLACGYITHEEEGEYLTEKYLKSLSNKEFIRVIADLTSIFENGVILEISKIKRNISNNTYSVNICSDDIKIVKYNPISIYQYYDVKGTRLYEDYDIDISKKNSSEIFDFVEKMDSYCDKHNIYYVSSLYGKLCPICSQKVTYIEEIPNEDPIFSDKYADHYRVCISEIYHGKIISRPYNLKVYKENSSLINISVIEIKIDKILSMWYEQRVKILKQDLFIPVKKVLIGENKKFIGYIYAATSFEINEDSKELLINIADTKLLKNLPRLKSFSRLCSQILSLAQENMSFSIDPYTAVFLSKEHKKQVQIPNIEFLSFKLEKTKANNNWIYRYIKSSFPEEESKIIRDDLPFVTLKDKLCEYEESLEKAILKLSKYCSVHMEYYSEEYTCCPKCVPFWKIEQLHNLSLNISVKEEKRIKNKPLNEGGESWIGKLNNDSDDLIKIFKDEVDMNSKMKILLNIFEKREILKRINEENNKYSYVFIKKFVFSGKCIKGYTMKNIEDGKCISVLRDKNEIQKLGFTIKDVLEILITVGEGIERLHNEAGIYIGDLNGRNILFDKDKNVYFIDFDGMGTEDVEPICFTEGYVDPEAEENHSITKVHDWYSFAIQAFYYLTYTHPFNGIYYEVKSGVRVNLEIVDKMKRKLSLLGDHGIVCPKIAEPWDWMDDRLKIKLLEIFEGNLRESIVEDLKRNYDRMYTDKYIEDSDDLVIEVVKEDKKEKPKFDMVQIYKDEGKIFINPKAYIDNDSNVHILDTNGKYTNLYSEERGFYIEEVIFSDKKSIFIVIKDKLAFVYDNSNNPALMKRVLEISLSSISRICINDDIIYYIDCAGNIKKVTILDSESLREIDIKFHEEMQTKAIFVKDNSKFIIVKRDEKDSRNYIFCNDYEFLSYEEKTDVEYNILYDSVTQNYVVLDSLLKFIYISHKLEDKEKRIISSLYSDLIDKVSIKRAVFHNDKIYMPSNDKVYVFDLNKAKNNENSYFKVIECPSGTVNMDSKYIIKSNGFGVITDGLWYEYTRNNN